MSIKYPTVPFFRPPPIGYSLGPNEEQVGKDEINRSGTLGGYVTLSDNRRVVLTCNHVANPRDLIPSQELPTAVHSHSIQSPSNQDAHVALHGLVQELFTDGRPDDPLSEKKKNFRVLCAEEAKQSEPAEISSKVFPEGSDRKIWKTWDRWQQSITSSKDILWAMSAWPTAAELKTGEKFLKDKGCTYQPTLEKIRNDFDHLWKEILDSPAGNTYQVASFQRNYGKTILASGLRVWPRSDMKDLSVLDWALVEVPSLNGSFGSNAIPESLKVVARVFAPGSRLAAGNPVDDFGPALRGGELVFKIGRSSGATAGVVDVKKEVVDRESLIQMGSLPQTGTLDGHDIECTQEWTVTYKPIDPNAPTWNQFGTGGDSGAWVINEDSKLVGMVFSGLPGKKTYITDIHSICKSILEVTGLKVTVT